MSEAFDTRTKPSLLSLILNESAQPFSKVRPTLGSGLSIDYEG